MKRTTALLLALVMCLSLLAGCTGKPADVQTPAVTSAPAAQATEAPTTEPVKDEIVMADDQTLYLAYSSKTPERVDFPWYNFKLPCMLMYRTLVLADATETSFTPELCTSFDMSADGLTYSFVLKDGLKWSDGEALTADDVVWSVETAMKAAQVASAHTTCFGYIEGAAAFKAGEAEHISGITVSGNTVSFKLSAPYMKFLKSIAQFAILPMHALEKEDPLTLYQCDFWTKPVGSNWFMFDSNEIGSYYVLVANPNYEGTAPHINRVVVYISGMTESISSGQADYAFTNSATDIATLSGYKNLRSYYNDYPYYRYFVFNMSGTDGNVNPAMQNADVRKALSYAIDQEALATLYNGNAKANYCGVATDDPDSTGVAYAYNPELAKKMLNDAGWDWNYTLRILSYSSDETSKNIISAVVAYFEAVGLKVEVVNSTSGTTDLFTTRNYDLGFKNVGTTESYYSEFSSTSATFQNVYGGDTSFDALLDAYNTATNDKELAAAKKALQELEDQKMFKLNLLMVGYMNYVNTDRVSVPEAVSDLGAPGRKVAWDFENWYIKG